jgi:hypothetical protein
MNTLVADHEVFASAVSFSADAMMVSLNDGRTISVPLAWYPRLLAGTQEERMHFEFIGDGEGIHWPDLDEDISIEGIVAGRRSTESASSLANWMSRRNNSSNKKLE